jgi:succinate dehydrogenase / fumarate reductase cytochrome b subunit
MSFMVAGKGAAGNRPLSPHLQIYRPQITSVLSILHRIAGVVLALGILPLVYWLSGLAGGAESYARAYGALSSVFGQILLFGWTLAFSYHFCNGVRHLFWDTGRGFELRQVYASGWAVLVGAVVLTALIWLTLGGGA